MNFTTIKKLPPMEEIIQQFPLSEAAHTAVLENRKEIEGILQGRDPRLIIIVGPCSAWPREAVLEYASKLKILQKKVKNRLKLVMRTYIQKPRTTKGWLGPVNQPEPFEAPDIASGIRYTRDMMVKIVEMGLPIADEALFTNNAKGFLELLSWVAIGARSSEDQEHRIFASAIDCPVGIKNPTHGSLEIAVNGIVAAQHPHVAVFDGHEVQTHGNPFAHLVLRGGNGKPNYSTKHLKEAEKYMFKNKVNNPAIIIDASHDNSLVEKKKNHTQQIKVVEAVMHSLSEDPDLKKIVKGFMLESFIKSGNQKLNPAKPESLDREGLSITDPCLSWEETERLLFNLAKRP
ncbi:MAG TPA: 3-deoxy-7-phosphoheptulonate synthase [Candidatus Limnocylindria bacterium]|nr:3-deoxy-7-phosphoheptulonate synthase [Candidatus Limnocylindria bacterium]